MKKKLAELKEIKGIGDVLAKRLNESGLDTFEKIAEAGEEGLKKIKGIVPGTGASIVEQARTLSGKGLTVKAQRIKEVKKTASGLKKQLEGLAGEVKRKFGDELVTKTGKKVEKELLKLIGYMEIIEVGLESKVRKTGKNLLKAEKRFIDLGAGGLKNIGRGLKKTRKSLKKLLK